MKMIKLNLQNSSQIVIELHFWNKILENATCNYRICKKCIFWVCHFKRTQLYLKRQRSWTGGCETRTILILKTLFTSFFWSKLKVHLHCKFYSQKAQKLYCQCQSVILKGQLKESVLKVDDALHCVIFPSNSIFENLTTEQKKILILNSGSITTASLLHPTKRLLISTPPISFQIAKKERK